LDKYSKVDIDKEIIDIKNKKVVDNILEIIVKLRKSNKYKKSKADRDVYQVK